MELGLDKLEGVFEKLAKLPKPYRLGLVPLIALLVGGVYAYLFYLPSQARLGEIRGQQLELQRKLNEVRSVATNISAFEEEIKELESKLSVALRQLPNSKELPVLLTDITSLGKNAGLEFKAFRPQTELLREFYAEVPIEIEFSGRFHDVASFFAQIARLPRIVAVRELRMKVQDESADSTRLTVSGSATTFRFLESGAGAPAPAAGKTKAPAKRARGGAA